MKSQNHIQVSLLIPCYNETSFIEAVIQDILNQSYTLERMEVLFLDGGSTDGTREILYRAAQNHPMIKWIDNPAKYVPQAMNLGIRESRGEILIRLDAHGSYPADYVEKLVYWSLKTGAANVGGIWETRPRADHPKAKAIAAVLSHPLGVGNSLFRLGVNEPTEVDTVPFGCYPRAVFDEYGLYDERLIRNQDIELNKRIRRAGGKIMLIPEVYCIYYARDTFRGMWENNYQTGRWVPLTIVYTGEMGALSLRHFIPFLFTGYLLCLGIISCLAIPMIWKSAFAVFLALYLFIISFAAIQIAKKQGFWTGLYAWIGFHGIHLAYGLGTWQGLLESIWKRKSH
ncbi:MAG: glycosyltransferase family 2 protein [Saprospiraceae bacterium]|nr:glycosyltransferase family 2 protein [Saprospiraceae bacterium]